MRAEKTAWFQVEFLSALDGCWVPLYGRSATIDEARDNRRGMIGRSCRDKAPATRIVRIERTVEVME